MNAFTINSTPIDGLKYITRKHHGDSRGSFSRLFCATELAEIGWTKPVAQINHSYSKHRGIVRGLHYQIPPYAEDKLVTCIKGTIWDVAVDLRPSSATYLKWFAMELSGDNHQSLYIPKGFAHGFQSLSDDVEMIYCHSAPYSPKHERGLRIDDPQLAIQWPLEPSQLSERDQTLPVISPSFSGVSL